MTISAWSIKSNGPLDNIEEEPESRYEEVKEQVMRKQSKYRKLRHFSEANNLKRIRIPIIEDT
jgi:hypothetical protein